VIFQFGEMRSEYGIAVLNEREVRAGAGILFFLALVSFMNAWLTGNFQPTQVFVLSFLIDFSIRIFVNPRFAPSLIIGRWAVRQQQPQWTGAPQKRFAWAIGFVLAAIMFYLVVLNNIVGPINLIVCALCLLLLFFETAFGICLGCKVYNVFHKDAAQLCPGDACEPSASQASEFSWVQWLVVLAFALIVAAITRWVYSTAPTRSADLGRAVATQPGATVDPAELERCKVPEFAKAMGHEEKWKLHNNCK
jgi:hypothetical protein